MPKRPKRPRDPMQLARLVGNIAVGEVREPSQPPETPETRRSRARGSNPAQNDTVPRQLTIPGSDQRHPQNNKHVGSQEHSRSPRNM